VLGLALEPRDCARLAPLLADAVRRAQARGDAIDGDLLATVEQMTAIRRAHLAATSDGSSDALPLSGYGDEIADAVTVRNAAQELEVSERRVVQLISDGALRGRKVAGTWEVHGGDVERRRAARSRVRSA
jgi:hypothetical protein